MSQAPKLWEAATMCTYVLGGFHLGMVVGLANGQEPAASFRPMARPRCFGPVRSIFMMTAVDQVRP